MTKPDNKLHNRYASSDFSYKGFVVKATLASDEQRRESYSSSSSQNEAMKHEQGSPVSTSMSCGSNS